jgi:hypothetical protein
MQQLSCEKNIMRALSLIAEEEEEEEEKEEEGEEGE